MKAVEKPFKETDLTKFVTRVLKSKENFDKVESCVNPGRKGARTLKQQNGAEHDFSSLLPGQ